MKEFCGRENEEGEKEEDDEMGLHYRDDTVKIYENEFIGWLRCEESDDAIWEYVNSGAWKSCGKFPMVLVRDIRNLLEEFEKVAARGENGSKN
ncbi:hypothetical protein FXO38_28832 [Capsicum annuum]|uniref:Uncharacterized protein n=1 Tax=Capsicum annuum TaxID=4072 RepID=A0A2G2Z8K5_CAPAN|nr:hypothetical protein FXO38_28832 [Capsicum annuum]KAF3627500.1 hypothetical protein FXO37_29832 [Capsicum annuum]PHT78337.1 hypothetical protein T459_16389 [Capsicum annuum]